MAWLKWPVSQHILSLIEDWLEPCFYWYDPTSPQPLLAPLKSVWQNKTCCSTHWYQVRFESLQNSFKEVPLLCNLIWVKTQYRHRGCHGPDWSLRTGLVSAGLDSTWPWRARDLFIGRPLCVCMHVCLSDRCARVYYVFAHSLRGEFILSAPKSIHQGWHFLPFHVQTKHLATCAIATPRDVERPDLYDLSVRNYTIVTPSHWFGTLPFYYFFRDRWFGHTILSFFLARF